MTISNLSGSFPTFTMRINYVVLIHRFGYKKPGAPISNNRPHTHLNIRTIPEALLDISEFYLFRKFTNSLGVPEILNNNASSFSSCQLPTWSWVWTDCTMGFITMKIPPPFGRIDFDKTWNPSIEEAHPIQLSSNFLDAASRSCWLSVSHPWGVGFCLGDGLGNPFRKKE